MAAGFKKEGSYDLLDDAGAAAGASKINVTLFPKREWGVLSRGNLVIRYLWVIKARRGGSTVIRGSRVIIGY